MVSPPVSPLAQSAQDILAALRLQQEWGVDALIEDIPWDVWEESPITPPPPRQRPAIQRPAVQRRADGGGDMAAVRPASPSTQGAAAPRKTVKTEAEVQAALAQAGDVAALVKASGDMPGITLQRTAKNHLAPVLVEDAPFLLVGDVPNEDEDRYGTLFAGPMGVFLDKVLASIGLERGQLAMAPAIPWRPPGGQRVSQRELEACLPILHRTISLARPKRIVTMGTTPAWMLLQQTARLSQLRGRWHEVEIPGLDEAVPLLPLWHPLQLGENAGRRKALWTDLLNLDGRLSEDKGAEG